MRDNSRKNRRGDALAVARNVSARKLNGLFSQAPLDGRSLRRKTRLIALLRDGDSGEPLDAHRALTAITALLELGETVAAIKALAPRLPAAPPLTDELRDVIAEAQAAHGHDPRAWKLLGVDLDAIGER
jgi:hypothetical protein